MADRNTVIRGNQIKDATITADELNVSVAGAGIAGGAGTALSVNVDNSTVEVNTDIVRVKDAGITAAKLAAAVAGNGLAGGAGTALSVSVDDSTIEISGDALRVKANGIDASHIDETDDYVFTGDVQVPDAPATGSSAVNKNYVDGVAQGLDVKESVRAGVTVNVPSMSGPLTVGGVSVIAGDRVLLMGQTVGSENGIYVVNAGAWVRSEDADGSPANEVTSGMFTFVEEGDYADAGFVLSTDDPITVGTTDLVFVQFSGAGQVTAGDGLSKVGNTLSVNVMGACEIDTDAVDVKNLGIDTARLANDAVDKDKIAADVAGLGLSQAVGGELDVNVDDSSIEVNVDTLRVKALGITNAMLAGSIADAKLVEDYIISTEVDDATIEFAGGSLNVKDSGISTAKINNDAVDKDKIAADVAGAGIGQNVDGSLEVKVDDSSIEIATDTLQVKALGITNAMLAGSIANDKLVDIADTKLVEDYIMTSEVDDTTIEFGASLNIKDDGIKEAKLNTTNAPTDGYVLSYASATQNFTWIAGTADSIKESDMVKSTLNASGAETVLSSFSGNAAVIANSVQVYLNGLIQEEGAGNDYTLATATGVVTFLTALEAGDIVIMNGVLDN